MVLRAERRQETAARLIAARSCRVREAVPADIGIGRDFETKGAQAARAIRNPSSALVVTRLH